MKRNDRDRDRNTTTFDREGDYLQLNLHRARYAQERFEEEGIRYIRPSETSDRFLVFGQGKDKFQFYAGSGLILGPYDERGIECMVEIAKHGRDGR